MTPSTHIRPGNELGKPSDPGNLTTRVGQSSWTCQNPMPGGSRGKYSSGLWLALYLTLTSIIHGGDLVGRVLIDSPDAVVAIIGVLPRSVAQDTSAIMDQKGMRFSPRILPIVVGSKVFFPNNERILYHNVYSLSGKNSFNLGTYRAGIVKSVAFSDTGIIEVLCNIHVRMYAAIIVLTNHFYSTVDGNGSYRIENIPVGTYPVELYFVMDHEVKRRRIIIDIPQNGEYVLDFE